MIARKPMLIEGGASQYREPPAKSKSGTYAKTDQWNDRDEVLMRHEAEMRYRDRTPPRGADTENPRDRVTLEEMCLWAMGNVRRVPPQTDEWEDQFYAWYDLMVERNPVHLKWLDRYALCGDKGEMPPLRTEVESEVTCILCKAVFSGIESGTDS